MGTNAPEAVAPLLEAKDYYHAQGSAADELCAIWEEKRDEFLKRIIQNCGYFAESPKRLNYIKCLMRDVIEQVVDADDEGVDILISLGCKSTPLS